MMELRAFRLMAQDSAFSLPTRLPAVHKPVVASRRTLGNSPPSAPPTPQNSELRQCNGTLRRAREQAPSAACQGSGRSADGSPVACRRSARTSFSGTMPKNPYGPENSFQTPDAIHQAGNGYSAVVRRAVIPNPPRQLLRAGPPGLGVVAPGVRHSSPVEIDGARSREQTVWPPLERPKQFEAETRMVPAIPVTIGSHLRRAEPPWAALPRQPLSCMSDDACCSRR